MSKILVVGPPRTGKTTGSNLIAHALDIPLYHSDIYKELEWDQQKKVVYELIRSMSGGVFEGCTVARALNLMYERNQLEKPCDTVFYFTKYLISRSDLTPGQLGMGTKIRNIMEKLTPWLRQMDVRLIVL